MAGKHSQDNEKNEKNKKQKKAKTNQETIVYDPAETRAAAARSKTATRDNNTANFKKSKKQPKKKKRGLRTFGKVVLTLAIILGILIGAIFWYVNDKLSKIQRIELNEEDLGISDDIGLEDYRNIAIFGVDSRSDNLEQGNRSDCIIIASINNKTKETKLISVYRDTFVDIDGHNLDKITHAYSYGSAQLALNTLNKNLDLNIKEFVTVNFDSVAEAVDQLGGITINIESQEELKYLNQYIDETANVTGKSHAKVNGIGNQTLNGVQAVAYSRIRYTSGGDYKRTERMRTVIEAMLNKVKTKGVGEINSFLDVILPKVYTNITTGDILGLLPSAPSFKITQSIGWPYDTKGITLDRWYGVPITLESNVTRLHQEAFGQTDYVPSQTVKDISARIVQRTGYTK